MKTETLILDGIWGTHGRWRQLRDRISANVGPCEIWRYDNTGAASLEELGGILAAKLRNDGKAFHLVGFSMGGLVIREAIRQAPDLTVRKAAFLHTPHKGSLAAWSLPLPAIRDLRPSSPFLRRLDAAPWTIPTLVSWCAWDLMVLPGHSARWERAGTVIRSPVPLHPWPILSPALHRAVTSFLAA